MASIAVVEQALIESGEWKASAQQSGFSIRALSTDAVVVRWRPADGDQDTGPAIAFVESYARLLRQAGIPATLILDARGPRVVCTPNNLASDHPRRLAPRSTPVSLPLSNPVSGEP